MQFCQWEHLSVLFDITEVNKHKLLKHSYLFSPSSQVNWYLDPTVKLTASQKILEIPTCKAILWLYITYKIIPSVFPSSSFPLQIFKRDCNYYGLTSVGHLNWRFHCGWVRKSHFQGKLWLHWILWLLFCISLQYLNTLKPDLQLSQLHKEKWKVLNHYAT